MAGMDGKVCIITGGTSGIGLVTAETLATKGARVIVIGRDRTRTDAALARIKRRAIRENRHDDARDEVILQRFEIYDKSFQSLLNHYSGALVHPVDALQEPTEIHCQIVKIIRQAVLSEAQGWSSNAIQPHKTPGESSVELGCEKIKSNGIMQNC